MDPDEAADVLDEMDPDEAADVLGDIGKERADALMALMDPLAVRRVRSLLRYPERTAGGLMTTTSGPCSPTSPTKTSRECSSTTRS